MSGPQHSDDLLPQEPASPEGDATERLPARPRPRPAVVPRWIQLVVVLLGGLGLYAVAKAAGTVLLLFLTAAVIALILNPLVAILQRARLPRGLAILLVYLGFFAALALAGALLAKPVADQFSTFRDDVPSIVSSANERLADVQAEFDRRGINIEVKRQGQTALQTLQQRVVGGTDRVVSFGTDLLARVITAGFGVILVFVLSVYMLIYGGRIGALARSVMPPGDGTREDDFPTRVNRAVGGYVRGQLLFSLAMGAGAGIGLYLFGVLGIFPEGRTYALGFGVFFGLMELIPYVGPFLGAAPPMLVAFFQDPLTAVWVGLLFVALQQIEGHIVAPTVFGHALRINPLLVIFALLFGAELFGILGALIALPTAAVVRETAAYLREHTVLEPWGTTNPLALAGLGGGPEGGARRCAECGTAAGPADAFCRGCGAELYEREPARGAHGG